MPRSLWGDLRRARACCAGGGAGVLRDVAGWEFVHVMVDDHSRLAYAKVLDDLTPSRAIAFLRRAVRRSKSVPRGAAKDAIWI